MYRGKNQDYYTGDDILFKTFNRHGMGNILCLCEQGFLGRYLLYVLYIKTKKDSYYDAYSVNKYHYTISLYIYDWL